MDQKPSATRLRGGVHSERSGDVVRLSWNHRGLNPGTTVFQAVLVTLLLLGFGLPMVNSRGEMWIFLTFALFSGLVGFTLARIALRWFWDESIELGPDSLTQVFRGPLAPHPKKFRRSEIIDIRLIRDSDHEPLIRLAYRGSLIRRQALIGPFLGPEHLEVLESDLRDWLCPSVEQGTKYPLITDPDESSEQGRPLE
jgi:hypothetical protein